MGPAFSALISLSCVEVSGGSLRPGRRVTILSDWRQKSPEGIIMADVTRILSAIEEGDVHAAEQLLPLVYDELRKLAVPLGV